MIYCLRISLLSQMKFKKLTLREGKLWLVTLPASWICYGEKPQWRNICLLKTKLAPQAIIIEEESKMGFKTLSKCFQSEAVFSALSKVIKPIKKKKTYSL